MKKILVSFSIYTIIASVAIYCFGFFSQQVVQVVPAAVVPYKINNAFVFLFNFFPSIVITAFLLGCSLGFGSLSKGTESRFSQAITNTFRAIMIFAIVLTFLLTITSQILVPFINEKLDYMRTTPTLLEEYLSLANNHIKQDEPELARQYAQRALSLAPDNERAKEISRKAEIFYQDHEIKKSLQTLEERATMSAQKKIDRETEEKSVFELLQKSKELYAKQDWFGAHYYATLAIRMAGPTDTNLEEARFAATDAWNKLSASQEELLGEDNLFFRKKLQGYNLLLAGNYVESYYIFRALYLEDSRKSRDPDVVRYLELAEDALVENYFFIDETYDLNRFESANNIYFSVQHKDSSYDIVLLHGLTELPETGGLVRYFRDFKIYSFNKFGQFTQSVSTPYAKMLSFESSKLDPQTQIDLGIDATKKYIPYIMLCGVDRNNKDIKFEPEYEFAENYKGNVSNQIFLPMPYDDFSLLIKTGGNTENVNPLVLQKMSKIASDYGYSKEVYAEGALKKVFFPFLILIFLLFVASIAWNYRLQSGKLFKFAWIFMLPFLNCIFHFCVISFDYVLRLFDYIFIALVGIKFALYVGLAFYVVLLVVVCMVFLARKGD